MIHPIIRRPVRRRENRFFAFLLVLITALLFCPDRPTAQSEASQTDTACERPGDIGCDPMGVYFYRFEPSFYTGFAPRCQDPERIHIHLGRGNQLRVTVVLSDRIIDRYLADLALRYQTYARLIENGRLILTQNRAYETFKHTIREENILEKVESRTGMDPVEYRRISLETMKRLNPGRIYHITIDFKARVREWARQLRNVNKGKLSRETSLDIINNLLPTRLYITEIKPGRKKDLIRLIDLYRKNPQEDSETWNRFHEEVVRFFSTLTRGLYSLKHDRLDFHEFTTVYPAGTYNDTITVNGMTIPLYPYPGKWRLHVHQRTRVADHISEAACYGYLPWIPYMHVGTRLHNSFHSLWFNIDTRKVSFIPDAWRNNTRQSREEGPYPYLWLVSRGPMSHGCTHINAGHISELRQLLPSPEKIFLEVETFRNKSHQFDVFDIDGDSRPEVMGVEYFHAYRLKKKKPHRLQARPDRRSFYKWLYQKGYRIESNGRVIFDRATTTKFIKRKAYNGKTYNQIPLYEAKYPDEMIQFYKPVSIPFTRELRRISLDYPMDPRTLKLVAGE